LNRIAIRVLTMPAQISVSSDALAGFCRAHAVRELAVFGSLARGEERADSDVDVLIDLRHEARIGLVTFQRMRDELAALFGRPVDLVTRDGINRHIRDDVLREARILYAE
jgi:predicted nucleotidyltransferase